MSFETLRTPEDRFQNLQGYDYAPHYIDDLEGYEDLRIHYVDEGPGQAAHTFLCLHGEPTWAYLYRKMIPVFNAANHRVVAPDFLGFGRSDKPVADEIYTFTFHRTLLLRFIERMNLTNITLVCQDWGGLLGLTVPLDMPERITRLIVMNTALATGDDPGPGFRNWKQFVADKPDFDIPRLISRSNPHLSDNECAAYNAPFPDARYRAGVRRFPAIVPISPDMEGADLGREAARWWHDEWQGPTFMAIGMQDPVLGSHAMYRLKELIAGCPEPLEIDNGGHFVQEHGRQIAEAALNAFG